MAWQLHYSSAETGPSGRAGFQIVADSRGLPAGSAAEVAPYLTYRPPPSSPTAPTRQQIEAMPVALSYGPVGDRHALVRCSYLGQDYSGRFGNFLGHALVLAEGDLVGVRPVEFWKAPLWAQAPARPGTTLPELTELMPGAELDPESLGQWLGAGGQAAYQRLGGLLELVRRNLVRGYGRLILVGAECEEIVRWIAVISYSLPWEAVTRLSFVTYSGDPASTRQLIVGTTPDVWIPSDVDATVLTLAEEPQSVEIGRFAQTARDLWRSMDFDGIDELAAFDTSDPDTAAALVALCLTGAALSEKEQSAVAELIEAGVPGWVWPHLGRRAELLGQRLAHAVTVHGPAEAADPCAARCVLLALRDPGVAPPPRPLPEAYREQVMAAALAALSTADRLDRLVGVLRVADAADLRIAGARVEEAAAALVGSRPTGVPEQLDRTPRRWREDLLAGLVAGLERSRPDVRASVLTPELCRCLADRDLRAAPGTAITVIAWQVRSDGLDRVEATVRVLRLDRGRAATSEQDAAFGDIWQEEPTAAEVCELVDAAGPRLPDYYTLSTLPARLFVRTRLKGKEAVEVATRIRQAGLTGIAAEDAEAVLLATGLADMRSLGHAYTEVEQLTALFRGLDPKLATLVRTRAAKNLAQYDPLFRMALTKRLPGASRDWLLDEWLAARANRDEQAALLEIAIRLREAGVLLPALEKWAQSMVNSWSPFGSMEGRFRKDPVLSDGLRRLMKPKRRGSWLRGGR
ncbi:hypothetical protein [Nonomuraea fuscirosea]|uniref:GAP1-N2 domain-containing protein n=1 Tax=Nonomuraea fuscirosea TaxID=1291556 RepID=UPI003403EC23